jgi:predicted lipid-binding transport protein (Tim44 family)
LPLVTRLARILLALLIGLVLSARMEAAAAHCARIVGETTVAAEPAAPPCHMAGMEHAPAKKPAAPKHQPASCDCIAFSKYVPTLAPARAASVIAYVDWARPTAMRLPSLDLAPERPPPRA